MPVQNTPASRASQPEPEEGDALVAVEEDLSPAELALVDDAVVYINVAVNRSGLELAAEVSKYVIERFFDGSYEAFRDPNRHKARSFNALCRRADLAIPQASLYAMVRVGQQLAELPPAVAQALTVKHHRALLPVADPTEKIALARRAAEEGWTAATLEAEARAARGPTTGGRPPLPPIVKEFRALRRVLDARGVDEPLTALSDRQREELETILSDLEARIANVRAALGSS